MRCFQGCRQTSDRRLVAVEALPTNLNPGRWSTFTCRHLLAIAEIEQPMETDRGEKWIGNYELEIREPGKDHEDPKLTLRWQMS
jgi:hypothetical protein